VRDGEMVSDMEMERQRKMAGDRKAEGIWRMRDEEISITVETCAITNGRIVLRHQ
jgi:hypothetical protein